MFFYPELWPFFIAGLIFIGLTYNVLRQPKSETRNALIFLLICGFIWCVGFIFEVMLVDYNLKIFAVKIEFLAITFLPVAPVLLVQAFLRHKMPRWSLLLLFMIPILTNLVIWTNSLHHLFWGTPTIVQGEGPFPMLHKDFRFWFFAIHVPLSYIYIFTSTGMLIHGSLQMPRIYRKQAILILIAIQLPTITDILHNFGIHLISAYNITPAVFSITGILFAWALFRFQFLELAPMARNLIFENMSEGIVVLDLRQRIVDLNPVAAGLFAANTSPIGKPITAIKNPFAAKISSMIAMDLSQADMDIGDGLQRHISLHINPIQSSQADPIGWIVTLSDITDRFRLYKEIENMAIRDSLTCALTRRHFFASVGAQIHSNRVTPGNVIAFIMLDMDNFKLVNDEFGHPTGDKVLVTLANEIQRHLREEDLFGRIGGDEFAVFLSNIVEDAPAQIAERICASINALHFPEVDNSIRISASLGVYITRHVDPNLGVHGLFAQADAALFRAKETGRGRVVVVRPAQD
jgi:diguanylate cyclase (GGDEF)-like protein